jgi:hypothetical protein
MKQCPVLVWQHPALEEEHRVWGHDFNAEGMSANNQGDAENARWDSLRCPAGVTGCCDVFRPRRAYTVFRALPHTRSAKNSNSPQRRYLYEN